MWKIVVLAGGGGTRLWPISRRLYPKQFLTLFSKESFLQQTVRRALDLVEPEQTIVVTNNIYKSLVEEQLGKVCDAKRLNIICEPASRNTAPAIALSVAFSPGEGNDDTMVYAVVPSDHYLAPVGPFQEALLKAKDLAMRGHIVLFGIRPTSPHVGYGYLKVEGQENLDGAFGVKEFIEKPDSERALHFVQDGRYLWNTGVFVFTRKTLLEAFQKHCPEIASLMRGSFKECLANFNRMPNVSIDYAIMEKSKRIVALPLNISWSDVGSWENVYEILDKDQNKNASLGPVVHFGARRSLFIGHERLVVANGVEDLAVIDTKDVLFISKLNQSQKVKDIVNHFKGSVFVEAPAFQEKEWGVEEIVFEQPMERVIKMTLKPTAKTSIQVDGSASLVLLKGNGVMHNEGSGCEVFPHRIYEAQGNIEIENIGNDKAVFLIIVLANILSYEHS